MQFSSNQLKIVDIELLWVPMLFRCNSTVVVNVSNNFISNFTNHKGLRVSDFSINNSFSADLTINNLTTIDINYLLSLFKVEHILELYNLGSGAFNIIFMDKFNPLFTMTCSNPPALAGLLIYKVPIQDFNCTVHEKCPAQCVCTKTVALELITVVCDNDMVESLPNVIPEGKYVALSVHSRNVRELSDRNYFRNVTDLDLSSSSISSIHDDFLHNFESLSTIQIYDNSLMTLPEGIQNMNLDNLTSLYLHGNPFKCDCHSKWMKSWLQKNRVKIPDLNQVLCQSGQANGKPIITALDSDFVCDGISLSLVLAISLGGFSVFVIIVFGGYCLREPIKVFLIANYRCFQCLRRKVATNSPFDIFISYSSFDETYVQTTLIPQLENDGFRLFTQDYFVPGIPITDNILNGIDSSFTTLIVLSNKFLESDWCRYEFEQAYLKVLREKERHLIILNLDNELNNELIPKTLKIYLKTNNYIKISEKRYLSRILLALPRIKGRTVVSERTPLLQDHPINT
ncbi:hypothetical protein CHS0354_035552 [Potamilus streckersoni]|uniref:TIR domain-containing protein n=1 Tax=Potamilus streckersoni TaxID=2493646 RepID=A0AAE0VHX3_9BIVA|nr:hypothetical protein CHS0354_035552 [Potamilus streckersoni]